MQMVKTESFIDERHSLIFSAMRKLDDAGSEIDSVLLVEELRKFDHLELVGIQYIADLLQSVPSARMWEHYAKVVRECWMLRWTSTECGESMRRCNEPGASAVEEIKRLHRRFGDALSRESARLSSRAGGAYELKRDMLATINGLRRCVSLSFAPKVSAITQALMPGTITVLVGAAGDGKTFGLLQSMIDLQIEGISSAMMALEGSRAYLLKRALAIRTGDGRLTNNEELESMGVNAMAHYEEHEEFIEQLGRGIFDPSHVDTHIDSIALWTEEMCKQHRVVFIDPITLADKGDNISRDDKSFMKSIDKSASRSGSSVVVVTHPKDTQGKPVTLESVPGGKAYQHAAQCVLHLRMHDERNCLVLTHPGQPSQMVYGSNRTMRVLKSRNGKNCGGMQFAMRFEGKNLRFEEFGSIVKQKKKDQEPEQEEQTNEDDIPEMFK